MQALIGGALGYDPLTCPISAKTLLRFGSRLRRALGRAYGMLGNDRNFMPYVPISLGGDSVNYLLGEYTLYLFRELGHYLNADKAASDAVRHRWAGALREACLRMERFGSEASDSLEISNFVRDAVIRQSHAGLLWRDWYEPVVSRLLDALNMMQFEFSDLTMWQRAKYVGIDA